MESNLKKALATAIEAAKAAGELIRREFARPGGPRHQGAHHADVDVEAEHVIREQLARAFPAYGFVGEETGGSAQSGPCWYVDPNDGTKAFIEGWRGSAVSIALVDGGRPVLGVVHAPVAPDGDGDLIAWAEGEPITRNGVAIRRAPLPAALGVNHVVLVSQDADRNPEANADCCRPARFRALPSIAYRLALVAVGEADAATSLNGPVAWDYAAGHALLRAVGGELLDARGEPVRYDRERGGNVFGGSPEAAVVLSGRDWSKVLKRRLRGPLDARYPLVQPSHAAKALDPGVLRRAQGALLGQVAGDSLGSLLEFTTPDEAARRHPKGVRDLVDGGTWNTIAGQPTDDTEMALMLARSLVHEGRFDAEAVRGAYVAWRDSRPFDIGNTVSSALSGYPNDASEANGSAMRVSPLAVFAWARPADAVAALARSDAALTHPNRVCLDATAALAVAIAHALRTGDGPEGVFDTTLEWARSARVQATVIERLEAARRERPVFWPQAGWVAIALQNAFFQLLHAPSLEEGIIDTVAHLGDSDTNGAIAGALLGAVHGREAVPLRWRRQILSCRPIGTRQRRPLPFWPVDVMELAEALVARGAVPEAPVP